MPRLGPILAAALVAALLALPGLARTAAPSGPAAARAQHHVPCAHGAHLRVRTATSSAWD